MSRARWVGRVSVAPSLQTQGLAQKLGVSPKTLLKQAQKDMKPAREDLERLLKEEAPHRTGEFAESIHVRSYVRGDTLELRTYHANPLGKWIVVGTAPHPIYARNFKFMVFWWEKGFNGPGVYRFRRVNHPGTRPNPYVDRALQRWISKSSSVMEMILTKWLSSRQNV